MSYGETQLTMPVMPAGYGNNGDLGLGTGGGWLGILFLVGLLGGGFGNGGFFGGGNNGVGAEVQRGFDHSATITKLDGITTGLADLGFALNNSVTSGFASAELGATNRMAQLMQILFGMQSDSQKCCCETQRLMERGFCDTQHAIQDSTRQIADLLVAQRIEAKDETIARQNQQIFQLQLADSQGKQSEYFNAIVNSAVARLSPPVAGPAYIVPNPNLPYNFGGFGGCGNAFGFGCC